MKIVNGEVTKERLIRGLERRLLVALLHFGLARANHRNEDRNQRNGVVARQELLMKRIAVSIFLLVTMVSGCSVLANSERFYRDRPPRAINWREYGD
jgi:hypothetical protein